MQSRAHEQQAASWVDVNGVEGGNVVTSLVDIEGENMNGGGHGGYEGWECEWWTCTQVHA